MSEPLNEDSLLNQLETIQKQMNIDSDRVKSNDLPSGDTIDFKENSQEPKRNLMFSGLLSKKEKTSSLPLFAGSSSHQGILAANSGQDMNFVMGLSENLLQQCRRLQAELEQKSKSVEDLQRNNDQLQESYDGLNSVYVVNVQKLESTQNLNRNLEKKLKEVAADAKIFEKEFKNKNKQLSIQINASQKYEQELKTEVDKLRKEIGAIQESHKQEIKGLETTHQKENETMSHLMDKVEVPSDPQTSENSEHFICISDKYLAMEKELFEAQNHIKMLEEEVSDLTNNSSYVSDDNMSKNKALNQSSFLNVYKNENILALPNDDSSEKINEQIYDTEGMIRTLKVSGFEVVPRSKYLKMKRILPIFEDNKGISDVVLSQLREILKEKGLIIGLNKDHESKTSKENPSIDYINTLLKEKNMVAVSKENTELMSLIESPKENMVIATKEYEQIMQKPYLLTKREVEKEAHKLGLEISPIGELQRLCTLVDNPTFESLQTQGEKMGFSIVNSKEYETLLLNLKTPSLEKVKDIAKSYGCVMIDTKHLSDEGIVEEEELETLMSEKIFVLLEKNSFDAIVQKNSTTINESEVISLCSRFNLVPLSSEKYENLLQPPNIDQLKSYASENSMVVVKREEYEILKSEVEFPTDLAVKKFADKKGLSLINSNDYNIIFDKANNPTKLHLEHQAEKLGLIVIPKERYCNLLKEIEDKLETAVLPNTSKVLASKHYFEEVIRNENEKPEIILESTKTLGFVTLSNEEYKTLKENQKDHILTKGDIYNGAKSFDLAILPNEEYMELLKKKNTEKLELNDLERIAHRFDMQIIPLNARSNSRNLSNSESHVNIQDQTAESLDDDIKLPSIEESQKESSSISQPESIKSTASAGIFDKQTSNEISTNKAEEEHISDNSDIQLEQLKMLAGNSGYNLTSNTNQKDESTSTDDCSQESFNILNEDNKGRLKAFLKDNGMVILSEEEYTELLNPSMTREIVEVNAAKFDLKLLSKRSYDKLRSNGVIDRDNVESKAAKFGSRLLTETEYKDSRSKVDDKLTTVEKSKAKGHDLGVTLVSDDELRQFMESKESSQEKSLSSNQLISVNDTSHSMCNIKNEKYENLCVSKESSRDYNCEELGTISNMEYKRETPPVSREEVIQYAEKNQLAILDKEQYKNLSKKHLITEEQIKRYAKALNLIVLNKDLYEKMKSNLDPTTEQITKMAKMHDMVLLKSDEYENIRKSAMKNKEQIIQEAKKYGLEVLDKKQHDRLKCHLQMTKEHFISYARKYDLVAISCEDYKSLKRKSATTIERKTKQNQKDNRGIKSPDPGFRNIGSQIQMKEKDSALIPSKEKVPRFAFESDESFNRFLEEAVRKGTLKVGKGMSLRRPVDIKDLVLLPKLYYNDLINKQSKDRDQPPPSQKLKKSASSNIVSPKNPTTRPSTSHNFEKATSYDQNVKPSKSSSVNADEEYQRLLQSPVATGTSMKRTLRRTNQPHTHNVISEPSNSVSDNISLASIASLGEPSMIPALTQTVIGEYLYKYYKLLGIESRHERFFWIHPYSLTLYWSSLNPALDHKPSSQRTKSAAIFGIESIPDPNPYPAGLYHKSLLIKSDQKIIKITCPTRKRHNIWYNSLRYLLQKSLEGVDLEEVVERSHDSIPSEEKYQIPRKKSNLGPNNFSSIRKPMSSKTSTKTLIPRTSTMPAKQ